jgi:phosphoglycolate phosphatase-like HAD superfamily hydrolase
MIRAVLFDLDGTLLDRETCVRNCIRDQFARFEDQLAPVTLTEFQALYHNFEQHGYVPKPVVYDQMRLKLGFSLRCPKRLRAITILRIHDSASDSEAWWRLSTRCGNEQ